MTYPVVSRRHFLQATAVPLILASDPTRAFGQQPRIAVDAARLKATLDSAIAFLRAHQKADGSFAPPRVGEPGVTALIAASLIRNGRPNEDVTVKALKYLESSIKPDGGVYLQGFATYTTSLAVMTFKEANTGGKYDKALAAANKFLRTLQYGYQDDIGDRDTKFGGVSYGKKGERGGGADLSNTHFFTEALLASGADKNDAQVKNALTFISRSQNLPGEFNDQEFAKKASEGDRGGFVYNLAAANDPKSDKRTATGGLRSEGGMTYAGLKSFLYAGVSKDDPRVKAAVNWVRRNYTLEENPGLGQAGLYYYYHLFAKAMDALGEDKFVDAKGNAHDWRKELYEALSKRQQADGSWVNAKDRAYMESLPELATAFATLALSYCK